MRRCLRRVGNVVVAGATAAQYLGGFFLGAVLAAFFEDLPEDR